MSREVRFEKVFFRTRFFSDGDSTTTWSDEHGNRIPEPRAIYRRVDYEPTASLNEFLAASGASEQADK